MLQDLIALTKTLDLEDSGGIIIVSAAWRNDKEDLEIELELNTGEAEAQRWTLVCESVREHEITLGWAGNLEVTDDHVLLWPHNKTLHKLWFNGFSKNVTSLIGELWQAHHKLVDDWFPFTRFLNCPDDFAGLIAGGNGKMAEGPEPLIDAYQRILEGHGVKTSITSHQPLHWNGSAFVAPGELVVLLVGNCHVIASRVEARE